ncbi:MAG: GTPase ObgE [Deltaproteobacteria bacterium]|nr:GTPase ObgE [Deltaproteobacteria bacterium]
MDRAKIWVRSGHGGAGCVSFRRERYVPKGGPDGGDGGRGGDVVIKAGDQRETLLRFRFNQHFHARNGSPGMGKNRTGESADDLVLMVPAGTAVLDAETGRLIADLPGPGDEFTVCSGGRGGQGNARFASGGFRTPRFAQPGGNYEERRIVLELRLLADAALVGYPNVGKSSLISRLSAATPKVADYPFTTLEPVLGTVAAGESSYVIADLPGLIDGASEGLGLGHEFLRHVSRAGVLLHVLDPTRLDPADPLRDLHAIRLELKRFDPSMLEKPALIAMSKTDLPEAPKALKALRKALPAISVLGFSSVTREGLDAVRYAVWNEVKAMREKEAASRSRTPTDSAPGDSRADGRPGRPSGTFSSRADALERASRSLMASGGAKFAPMPDAQGLEGRTGAAPGSGTVEAASAGTGWAVGTASPETSVTAEAGHDPDRTSGAQAAKEADPAEARDGKPGKSAGAKAGNPGKSAGAKAGNPGDSAGVKAGKPGKSAGAKAGKQGKPAHGPAGTPKSPSPKAEASKAAAPKAARTAKPAKAGKKPAKPAPKGRKRN